MIFIRFAALGEDERIFDIKSLPEHYLEDKRDFSCEPRHLINHLRWSGPILSTV